MTVLVKNSKSVTHPKEVTKSRGATSGGLAPNEINEFNLQTNKERKKVKYVWYLVPKPFRYKIAMQCVLNSFFPSFFITWPLFFFLAFQEAAEGQAETR